MLHFSNHELTRAFFLGFVLMLDPVQIHNVVIFLNTDINIAETKTLLICFAY